METPRPQHARLEHAGRRDRDAAWFTASQQALQQPSYNANGIAETPDHRALLVIQSATGILYHVDPETGVATAVDLGGVALTAGDGAGCRPHPACSEPIEHRLGFPPECRRNQR